MSYYIKQLILLYRELDVYLYSFYRLLNGNNDYPKGLRKMWGDLADDELEHLLYWDYLRDHKYGLNIIDDTEKKEVISKLTSLIKVAKDYTQQARKKSVRIEEAFDTTVNIELSVLLSPMQKLFHTHDIILKKTVFNPYIKYEQHLKRITDNAEKFYKADHLKLTLIKSMSMLREDRLRLVKKILNDALTGTKRREYFFENSRFLIDLAYRDNKSIAIIMIDIDDFKNINDKYGHLNGDRVLKKIGALLNRSKRTVDIVARFGGDEFVLLLYNQDEKGVKAFLKRLGNNLKDLRIKVEERKYIDPRLSFGYAIGRNENKKSLSKLISLADMEMYKNKTAGRNK